MGLRSSSEGFNERDFQNLPPLSLFDHDGQLLSILPFEPPANDVPLTMSFIALVDPSDDQRFQNPLFFDGFC